MKFSLIFIILTSWIFLQSCKNEVSGNTTKSEFAYPLLPDSLRARLNSECTQIEYLFSQGFSASSSSKGAVTEGIDHSDTKPVPKSLLTKCKSLGRNQFLAGFNIIIESDIYYSEPDCTFFIFKRKGIPVYSAMMKDSGKKFFASVFNSANPYGNQKQQ